MLRSVLRTGNVDRIGESDFDFVGLAEASVVVGAAHVLGERFHIDGFFAIQTGFADAALLFGFGNTKDLCLQSLCSLSKVSAESVGVLSFIGVTGVACHA